MLQIALQGRRRAGRLPHRRLVHLPARQAAQEALCRQPGAARSGLQESDLRLRARRPARAPERASRRRPKLLKEMNGYYSADPAQACRRVSPRWPTTARRPAPRGSIPACFPRPTGTCAARKQPDPPGQARRASELGLRVAGEPAPALQPRLGRSVRQAMERAQEVDLVGRREVDRLRRPGLRRRPSRRPPRPKPGAIGLDAHSGHRRPSS